MAKKYEHNTFNLWYYGKNKGQNHKMAKLNNKD